MIEWTDENQSIFKMYRALQAYTLYITKILTEC